MTKRAKILIAGLTVAILGVIDLAGAVLAADPNQGNANPPTNVGPGWGYCGGGFGPIWSDAVTKLLGLTPEQIQAQRQEGKSLAQIAAAKGVTEDALVAAIIAPRKDLIQQRVKSNVITQEQANLMLKTMEQNIREAVKKTALGPSAGRGTCGFGPGMMRGWAGQTNQGAGYGPMGGGMMGGFGRSGGNLR